MCKESVRMLLVYGGGGMLSRVVSGLFGVEHGRVPVRFTIGVACLFALSV